MGVVIRRDRWGGMAIADLGMLDDAAYEAQSFLDDDTGYDLDPVETVSIDGHAAKLYSISDRADMDIGYPVEAVTRVDGDTVVLWGFYSDAADKDEFLSVFREMVATFRRSIARSSSTSSAASGTVLSTLSEVLAGAGDLSIPFKAGVPRGSWYDLSVLTQAGIRSILSYDERIPPDSLAWPYATTPDGLLFIRTSEDGGFRMFDRQGNDVSGDYPGYKNKEFSVTEAYNLDANRIVYGVHDADTHGRPEVIAGIHILDTRDGSEKVFPMSKLGLGRLQGLQPVCLSADGASMYIRLQGWEGFSYETVWKLSLADFVAVKIFGEEDKIVGYHCSDRRDMIFGVRSDVDRNVGMGGAPNPPSSIVLFDGKSGSLRTIVSYEDKLVKAATLTPDGSSVIFSLATASQKPVQEYDSAFYQDDTHVELVRMNPDGGAPDSLGEFKEILGMSADGRLLVVTLPHGDGREPYVLNTDSKRLARITDDGGVQIITCNYGQGFDCHYPR